MQIRGINGTYAELGLDNVGKRVLAVDTIQCMTPGIEEKKSDKHLEKHQVELGLNVPITLLMELITMVELLFVETFLGKGGYNSEHDIFIHQNHQDVIVGP